MQVFLVSIFVVEMVKHLLSLKSVHVLFLFNSDKYLWIFGYLNHRIYAFGIEANHPGHYVTRVWLPSQVVLSQCHVALAECPN